MISVSNRAMSSFPLSVGTGLALESVFKATDAPIDPDRKPPIVDMRAYDTLAFNVTTLIRNAYQALPGEGQSLVTGSAISQAIEQEIEVLNELSAAVSLKAQFFANNQMSLNKWASDKCLPRMPSTKPQKHYAYIEHTALMALKKKGLMGDYGTGRSLVLTHKPLDILKAQKTSTVCDLLESHTGKVKTKLTLNSKYHRYPSQTLDHMPFNPLLLFILGDSNTFHPLPIAVRKELVDISLLYHWNPTTTTDRILQTAHLNSALLYQNLRNLIDWERHYGNA